MSFKSKWKIWLFASLATAFLMGAATSTALWQTTVRFGNAAAVKAVGLNVYWDKALTKPVSRIDWGTVEPGGVRNVTVYIVNISSVPITLTFHTENWNPPQAARYITLSWNYSGVQVQPLNSVPATFTLSVSPSIVEVYTFNFDIVVVGSG